jgi:hypothetical protein
MSDAENKYSKYIIRDTLGFNMYPPYTPRFLYDTRNDFPGLGFGIRYTYITEPLEMETPHSHDFDQIFCFMGCPEDLRIFDGEVEVYLGEEQTRHIINSSSVVFVPKGMIHTPFKWKKVNKPMMFINIVLSNDYTRTEEGYDFPDSLELDAKKITLEEGADILGAPVPQPQFLPAGMKIQEVYLQNGAVKMIIGDKIPGKRVIMIGDAISTRNQTRFMGQIDLQVKYHPRGYPGGELKIAGEKVDIGDNKGIWAWRERNVELDWLQPAGKGQYAMMLSTGKGIDRDEFLKIAASIK